MSLVLVVLLLLCCCCYSAAAATQLLLLLCCCCCYSAAGSGTGAGADDLAPLPISLPRLPQVCWGCKHVLEPMASGDIFYDSYYAHEPGGSPRWVREAGGVVQGHRNGGGRRGPGEVVAGGRQ